MLYGCHTWSILCFICWHRTSSPWWGSSSQSKGTDLQCLGQRVLEMLPQSSCSLMLFQCPVCLSLSACYLLATERDMLLSLTHRFSLQTLDHNDSALPCKAGATLSPRVWNFLRPCISTCQLILLVLNSIFLLTLI